MENIEESQGFGPQTELYINLVEEYMNNLKDSYFFNDTNSILEDCLKMKSAIESLEKTLK